jgi:hypothetical protein
MQQDTLILYTHHLRGQIDMLPPLFTFLRELRKKYAAEKTLLLDLGDACTPDVWHCGATQGRSMLIVLDAMGYHAANVKGFLSHEGRAKLAGVVTMKLMDDTQPFVDDSDLQISLVASDKTELRDNAMLSLVSVIEGQVGVVQLSDEHKLITHDILSMSPRTAPDPTIAGVVDFVLSEAKYYGRKKGDA